MSSLRRSDAPPSLEAANQAQIDDLVQRNRTLEYAAKKFSEQLETEKNRSKEAVLDIQKRWHEQEKSIREECEDFLAYYRFVQLSTVSALETERLSALNEQKALREEKLLRLQRDFRVTMFHAKERELEERVFELEEEKEKMILERKELAASLRKKLAQLVTQVRLKDKELADLNFEREEIEKDVGKLHEQNARLQTSLDTTKSKLERASLQLEGAHSARSELEGLNEDLKRKSYDLQRQLDKWQRLESKGDAELESLRSRKTELEDEVKDLRKASHRAADSEKALEKEKRRTEKLNKLVHEWKETADAWKDELDGAKDEIASLQKELEKLRAQQAHTPSETAASKVKKSSTRSRKASSATDSETEHEAPKRNRPTRRKKGSASESEADDVQEIQPSTKASRKQKQMSPVIEEDEDVVEVEVDLRPAKDGRKATAGTKPKPRPRPVPKPSNDAEQPTPSPAAPTQTKRKRKSSADDSDIDSGKPNKLARTASKSGQARVSNSTATKKTASRAPSEDPAPTMADPVQKAKKRKINLFATAGSQSTQLGLDFGLGGADLNIPTSLTPLKEVEGPVPNRTVSTANLVSGIGGVGGLMRHRMGGR